MLPNIPGQVFKHCQLSWEVGMLPPVFGVILLLLVIINYTSYGPNLRAIPAFGPRGRLTSYIGSYMFLTNSCGVLQDEIAKRQGEMFCVPFIDHWEVVITGKTLINELAKAHESELSAQDAVADVLQTEFTMGPSIKNDPYHVDVIGLTMTRNLAARFNDICDEISTALEDVITDNSCNSDSKEDWVSVAVFEAVNKIIARTSNRLFVGLPLCRSTSYLDLSRKWAMNVFVTAFFINFMPGFLKPICQRIVQFLRRHRRHPGIDQLRKTVSERVLLDRDLGVERPDRPNDAISWFYDAAIQRYPFEGLVDDIVQRIMFMNFSAIHTSTHALTNVLYHLAERPEKYLHPLRNEVEEVIAQHGWTKPALREMVKIDSFVRESERINGLSALIMTRKVVSAKGFTFSNGVHLPMNSIVSVANYATHHDNVYYPEANTFEGFRFSDMREAADGFEAIRHQFVHTTPEHVTFGHGRHSCPGRFFAANELKVALAHIVLHYDLKLGDACNGIRPKNSWLSIALIPDRHAHICFRRRKEKGSGVVTS